MERLALAKIYQNLKKCETEHQISYNHCKIYLISGVNIFKFSTSTLHFLYFMVNYVVCLTLFPNFKVLVLAEILDLPCPIIFKAGSQAAAQRWVTVLIYNVLKWFHTTEPLVCASRNYVILGLDNSLSQHSL